MAKYSNGVMQKHLDNIISRGRYRGNFPASIELLFQTYIVPRRVRTMRSAIIPIIVLYNLFLVADWVLAPDRFYLSVGLHFLLVTPWIWAASRLYAYASTPDLAEAIALSVPLVMITQIMLIYSLSRSISADHYQYMALLVIVYANINQQLGYKYAVKINISSALVYGSGLYFGPSEYWVKFAASLLVGVLAYGTLLAAKRMDGSSRYHFVVQLREQLRRENAEQEAQRDSLTQLWNRRYLEMEALRIWKSRTTDGNESTRHVAVAMVDIDYFKIYNDYYGHPGGDVCIKAVAAAVNACGRHPGEFAVRLGGEEFLLILPDCNLAEGIIRGQELNQAIRALNLPHAGLGEDKWVTASVGVMAGQIGHHSLEEMISGADTALYTAKRLGRNQVFPPVEMAKRASHTAEIPLKVQYF